MEKLSLTSIRRERQAQGFTTVELLTVLGIVGLVSAMAAPAFGDFVSRQRVRDGTFSLMSDLMLTRSEAVKRGQPVSISATGGSWASGWTIGVTGGNEQIGAHSALGNGIVTSANVSTVTFNQSGRSTGTVQIQLDRTPSDANGARCVVIMPSGRASVRRGYC